MYDTVPVDPCGCGEDSDKPVSRTLRSLSLKIISHRYYYLWSYTGWWCEIYIKSSGHWSLHLFFPWENWNFSIKSYIHISLALITIYWDLIRWTGFAWNLNRWKVKRSLCQYTGNFNREKYFAKLNHIFIILYAYIILFSLGLYATQFLNKVNYSLRTCTRERFTESMQC